MNATKYAVKSNGSQTSYLYRSVEAARAKAQKDNAMNAKVGRADLVDAKATIVGNDGSEVAV